MTHVVKKSARRSAVAVTAVVVGLVALAAPAWAHVEAELGEVSNSGLAEVTFGFHHGCEGLATTGLRIQIPEGVSDITLEPVEGFTTDISDAEFGWSGGSVPDGQEAAFIATVQLSGEQGDVVAFPTIQQCGDESLLWDGPPEASNEDETDHPAPSITLPATYATADPSAGVGSGSSTTDSAAPTGLVTTTTLSDGATPETTESNTTGLVVFIVIVAVLSGGALYLYLSNRRPRTPAPPTEAGDSTDPDASAPTPRSPH